MKKQILFLAANPAGTAALKLDEEARAIQEELQRAHPSIRVPVAHGGGRDNRSRRAHASRPTQQ